MGVTDRVGAFAVTIVTGGVQDRSVTIVKGRVRARAVTGVTGGYLKDKVGD